MCVCLVGWLIVRLFVCLVVWAFVGLVRWLRADVRGQREADTMQHARYEGRSATLRRTMKRRRSSTCKASGFFSVTSASSAFSAALPLTAICSSCKPTLLFSDGCGAAAVHSMYGSRDQFSVGVPAAYAAPDHLIVTVACLIQTGYTSEIRRALESSDCPKGPLVFGREQVNLKPYSVTSCTVDFSAQRGCCGCLKPSCIWRSTKLY